MNQQVESKKSHNTVWIIFFTFVATGFVVGMSVFLWQSAINNSTQNKLYNEIENDKKTVKNPDFTFKSPILSEDKKNIISNNGDIILSIDDNTIFTWFKIESQLCDEYNLTSASDRAFCENKAVFREKTKFASISVSPDKEEIGFTIESETLTPDTVVGIFSQSKNTVKLLTGYYLGNKFIGFSPNGTHFIYKGECWEAMCGLFVGSSKTFDEIASINNPEYVDYRGWDAEFIQWISDNEVEYKLKSINSDEIRIERKSF